MRVPQVSERIKEAPAQALRGVFAGIGQLLLITDKLRHKTPVDEDVPRARTPETAETVTDAPVTSRPDVREETEAATVPPTAGTAEATEAVGPVGEAEVIETAEVTAEAAKPPRRKSTRNFDKTGNVRLLSDEANGSAPSAVASEPVTAAAPEPVTAAEPEPVTAAEPAVAPPLPNYDALTVASLRARLRNLDVAQVRQLAEYERAHAGRDDVLAMYERRIAKLEAQA